MSEVSLKGVPMACRCSFYSENTNKTVFFKNIYVRAVQNPSKISPDFEYFPPMKPIEEYNMEEVQKQDRVYYEIPKSIIIPNNAKSAMFTCEMDLEAVSLTWEFTSLLKHFKGAIIFQTKVGLSPYVSERYQVDVSKLGVYSLIVKKIIPEVIGSYKCSMLYNDKDTIFYKAYLVVTNVYPMYVTKNPGPKNNGVFTSVIKYFGKMQPFLKCTSGEELYPTKLLDYKETSTKVLFKKLVNHTQFPFFCDVWFRDEDGETIMFQLGTSKNTIFKNKNSFLKNFYNILNCDPILISLKFFTILLF